MPIKPYHVQSHLHSSTAGASLEWDSYVTTVKDSRLQLGGDTQLLSAFAATYDGFTPGVDAPFFYGFETLVAETPQVAWRRKRIYAALAATRAGEGLYVGTPIMDAPPDTTPAVNTKFTVELPLLGWAKNRKQEVLGAINAIESHASQNPAVIPAATYSAGSCELLSEIQEHLLESTIDGGLTWSLWIADEVLGFLNQRLSDFRKKTMISKKDQSISATVGNASYDLATDLITVQRIAWQSQAGVVTTLPRVDEFMLDNGDLGWETNTGTPYGYIEAPDQVLTITLVPTPNAAGTILVRYVGNHPTVVSTCSILDIPGAFVPYIKYGVMADMLSKQGEANDPERASYCEGRYVEGVELANLMMGR